MRAEFDDNLITGNEMIDSQHRELIDRINSLLIACEKEDAAEEAAEMLKYLSDYVNFHFEAEEKFQEEIGYPGIKEHKAKHAEFKQTVGALEMMLGHTNSPRFTSLVQNQMIDWLYTHIKGFDRSVAEYRFIRENPYRL